MSDLLDSLDNAANTLVRAPSMSGDGDGGTLCAELLRANADSATVLWVTYSRPPAACVDPIHDNEVETDSLAVIAIGETVSVDEQSMEGVSVETISSASDLTALGIAISRSLAEYEELVVCFDSLTALLQYVDVETAYAFVHTVTGQLYAADATAHFHLDPSAHDPQTIDVLASLFDAIVDCGDERQVRIRKLLQ